MNAKKTLVAVALTGVLTLPATANAALVGLSTTHGLGDRGLGDLRADLYRARLERAKPAPPTSSSRTGNGAKSPSLKVKQPKSTGGSKTPRRGKRGPGPVAGDVPLASDGPPVSADPPGSTLPKAPEGSGGQSGGSSEGPPPVADAGPGGNGAPDGSVPRDSGDAPDVVGDSGRDASEGEPGSILDELPNTGIGDIDLGPGAPGEDELTELLVSAPAGGPSSGDQFPAGPSPAPEETAGLAPNHRPMAAVPEPASLALLALGLAGLGAARRKRPAA